MMKLPGILCACGLLAAGCATEPMGGSADSRTARIGGTDASSSSASVSSEDARFMREAAQSGLAEVKMGQLAQEKGQSQHIKQMGQMLVRDHQKANQELMMIASKKGMQLPTEMGAQDQAVIQRLNSASGSGFDQLVATENMRAHQDVIQKFQAAQPKVQDPELKAFIEKTLPVLQTHLDHARQAQMQQSDTAKGGADSLESQPSIPQHGADSENPTPQPTPGSPTMDQDQADKQ